MIVTTIAIIIGNGLDRDLGLPSSFAQFAESDEWKNLLNAFQGNQFGKWGKKNSLIWHLNNSIKPNWFDIEEEIHNFINNHPKVTKKQENIIHKEFDGIRQAFQDYLVRVTKDFKADPNKKAYELLCHLPMCPVHITKIIFNYTDPELFLMKRPEFASIFHCTCTYVHGSLMENNIVLGCDIQEGEKVNRSLSFMYKYNMLKRANFVSLALMDARDVVFFGHSINEMDFGYFREFFKMVSSSPKPFRYLTIITWDENTERDIKDNIRNQGISVTDLYNNLFSFTFIHTSKIYKGDKDEEEKWKDLLFRLQTEKRHDITPQE